MEDILAITTDDARRFYRSFYAPNRATVIIAGDFDPGEALALVARSYDPIPPAEVREPTVVAEPPPSGERRAQFEKPVSAERAVFAYRAPAQTDPGWLPLLMASEVLCGGQSSRLWRELVVERAAATSVSGSLTPFRDPGLCQFYASLMGEVASAEAEEALDRAVAQLAASPPTPAELAKVKNRLETGFWSELDSVDGKAESLGHYETTLGDHRLLFDAARRLSEITAEEVSRAAAEHLRREARTVVVVSPSDDEEDE
jgi:predicted Zn-dependent peptidase